MINIPNWLKHQLDNADAQYLPGGKRQVTLPIDVIEWVEAHFVESDRLEALSKLARVVGNGSGRLARCLLLLSRGDLGKLDDAIRDMQADWRDVILWAEYVQTDGEPVQIRDLSRPIGVDETLE